MICQLNNPDKAVPGGWYYVYTSPDKVQVRIDGSSFRDLLRRVGEFCRAEGVKMDVVQEVTCQICARVPPSWCVQVSEGLGDSVAKVLQLTGVRQKVMRYNGGTCGGCGGRQRKLNNAVPYRRRRLR